MLIARRRVALVYLCLAGMEMAWLAPFLLLFYQGSPWLVYSALCGALLAWMLALDLLARQRVDSAGRNLIVAGLILASSLALVRALLYGDQPLFSTGWLAAAAGTLFAFRGSSRAEWGLIIVNLFLWQRAASATRREMGFFGIGLSFRLGILLLIVTGGLYSSLRHGDALPFLWIYLALGLLAIAITRINERAANARSAGTPLPPRRLIQILVAVGATVGATAWLASFYTRRNIVASLGLLMPVWRVLGIVLLFLLELLFELLMPVFRGLASLLRGLSLQPLANALNDLAQLQADKPQKALQPLPVPAWVWPLLRDLGIVLALAVALAVILLYLGKAHQWQPHDEDEKQSNEELSLGGSLLGRGWGRLRDLAGLVRRFGLGGELLAAVSVQNIYANLCRLARQRGYPRRPAQPPDDYLPVLAQAFEGQQDALTRITAAYMRVHYGDQALSRAELTRLRADYQDVRDAK